MKGTTMSEHTPDGTYNEAERTDVELDQTGYRNTKRDETHVDQTGYKGVTRGVVHHEQAHNDGTVENDEH